MEPSKQHSPGTASDYLLCSLPGSAQKHTQLFLCAAVCVSAHSLSLLAICSN